MSEQTHYKCIQHKIAFQTRFPDSKSRNNALHADCCKVTIELPAHAAATIRVFLPPETVPSRKLYLNYLAQISSFDKNSNLSVIPVLRHCDVYAVNSARNLLEIFNRLSTEFLSETSQGQAR